jgi:hypothetical protein
MLEVIQTILLLFLFGGFLWRLSQYFEKKRRIKAKKLLVQQSIRSKKTLPITQERNDILLAAFKRVNYPIWSNDIINLENYLKNWSLEKQNNLTGDVKETLQTILNRLLKFYAKKLNESCSADQEFNKSMSSIKLDKIKDSYSVEEIQKLVNKARGIEKEVEERKKEFWEIHDIVRDLGFETWGDVSYKAYICLK